MAKNTMARWNGDTIRATVSFSQGWFPVAISLSVFWFMMKLALGQKRLGTVAWSSDMAWVQGGFQSVARRMPSSHQCLSYRKSTIVLSVDGFRD